jgi:manganese transport system permease protein/manganese/iron transport system permease protein
MIEALGMSLLIGAVCASLSCFLILKGWSLMGDAISHAVLPGIVIAYVLSIPLSIGAFVAGLICTSSAGWIKNNSRIKEDTVLGVVFTGLFAVGLVMFSKIKTDMHLNHILFGSLLGIEYEQMIQATIISILVIAVTLLLRKNILLYCFDSTQAHVSGLNLKFIHYLFLSLIAATVVASLQAVGVILTVAMLITPGCIGYMISKSFDKMLLVAILSSSLSSFIGTYLSYYINGATGPCIVVIQSLLFYLVAIFNRKFTKIDSFTSLLRL